MLVIQQQLISDLEKFQNKVRQMNLKNYTIKN